MVMDGGGSYGSIKKRRKLHAGRYLCAPDWIIEIVSPGSRQMDYFTKLFKYQTAGVREYWIVGPEKDSIMVYRFEEETMEQYSFGDDVPVGICEGFLVKVQ